MLEAGESDSELFRFRLHLLMFHHKQFLPESPGSIEKFRIFDYGP